MADPSVSKDFRVSCVANAPTELTAFKIASSDSIPSPIHTYKIGLFHFFFKIQRLIIFRCMLGLDTSSFAKLFGRKRSVLSNWESGCRSIKTIFVAKKYMKSLSKYDFEDVDLSVVLKNWDKIEKKASFNRGSHNAWFRQN